jgi:hypothetical protein
MVLAIKLSFFHIITFSILWLVITLFIFNRNKINEIIQKRRLTKIDPGENYDRVIHTNRFTVNVVYDTDLELDINSICDLTISYEKLLKGGYKIIESDQSIVIDPKKDISIKEFLNTRNPLQDSKPQEMNEDLNNYVNIKTIKK